MDWEQPSQLSEQYYVVEKILDMKLQDGRKMYLIKWLNWDVKTCTWEEEASICHLKHLIKDYHRSRRYDKQHNLPLKVLENVQAGTSPYEETKYFGHFLYGDQPREIVEITVTHKNGKKIVYFEIEWEARENGVKPNNSMIDSRIAIEHAPKFVVGFYENRVRLVPT